MLKVNEVIVVEGRYDKNALSQIVDATILETSGFGIFSDRERLGLIRRLAEKRGVIILTDGDGAGFMIRNYLKGAIASENIKHAYIPDIKGKERRKNAVSKEGKLGVEGMAPEVLLDALKRAGATFGDSPRSQRSDTISKTDLFSLGLLGADGSAERRAALARRLGLPSRLSSNALLDVLNALYTLDEIKNLL